MNRWVDGVLFIVTDHIQGWVRFGYMPIAQLIHAVGAALLIFD
jgi:hypothetical protein